MASTRPNRGASVKDARAQRAALTAHALERYAGREAIDSLIVRTANPERTGESVLVKGYEGSVEKIDGTDGSTNNVLTYAITTDSIDRANDRVDPMGIDIANYSLNSPILWSHDHSIPAIASGRLPRQTTRTNQGRRGVLLDLHFHMATELSRELHAMAVGGFLPAGSIGFIPLAWEDAPVEEFERKGEKVYPFTDTVRTYTKWELLEFSLCNVPMNPTAVLQSDFAKSLSAAVERGVIAADAELIKRCGGQRLVTGSEFVLPTKATAHLNALVIENAAKDQDDAPGYTDATVDGESCATCEYSGGMMCMRHDFKHGGDETVCDDFEPIDETADGEAADKSYLDILTQIPSDMKDLSSLAAKAGVTPEQLSAVIDAAKAEGHIDEKSALDDKLAVRDIWEDIWSIHSALSCVVEEAAKSYIEDGDEKLLKALPDSYKSAADKIVTAIKEAKTSSKSFTPGAMAKAGAVLSQKNQNALNEAKNLIDSVLEQAKKEDTKTIDGTSDMTLTVELSASPLVITTDEGEEIDVAAMLLQHDGILVAMSAKINAIYEKEVGGATIIEASLDTTDETTTDEPAPTGDVTGDGTDDVVSDEPVEKTADALPTMNIRFKGDE